ncbi:MAG: CoA transferase [Pseudomonadota bacterium]
MLNGIRVLDLSTDLGLMCGQLLADMGADVQQWVAPEHADRAARSRHWRAYTRGKGVQMVDWRRDAGRLRAQVAMADVLVESEPPGTLAALGLDAQTLRAQNPALIHVSITPFGSDGPKAGHVATDLTATAASGHLYVSGRKDRPPVRISSPQAHAHASADAAVAVLIALAERARSGRGQHVDVAAQESSTLALLSRGLDGAVGQPKAERAAYANVLGNVALRTQFRARDGWVVVLQGVLPPLAPFMARLMEWAHEEGHCSERELSWAWGEVGAGMYEGRITEADWAPVQDAIERLVAPRSKAELMREAVERRLLLAPVLSVADLLASEHMQARGFTRPARKRAGQRLGPFARFSASPLPQRERAPSAWATPGEAPPGLGFEPAPGEGPLAGLKVLDLFWVVAGPGATRMLADYGATVVHVESSRRLDMVRNVPPYVGGERDPERAACHHTTNCNKLNVCLDLTTDEGRTVLADLIRWADVFTESFAPGVASRMGFDYAAVKALNPEIIMISSSLMGQDGPWSRYAGYGNLAAAVSGFHALTGHPDEPPVGCFGPYTDFTSVRFNALAILGALRHRARTGEGQYIDMAQVEAALQFLAPECVDWLEDGVQSSANGNRDPEHAPSGVYPVAGDDRWIAIAVADDQQWRSLCEIAGFDDLLEPGATVAGRRRLEDRIDARLAEWTGARDGVDLEARLQAAGVPAQRVLDTAELARDAQLRHRGHFIPVHHRLHAPAVVESSRLRFSHSACRRPQNAPWFGIDNARVLRDVLGYDRARIQALEAAGVLE